MTRATGPVTTPAAIPFNRPTRPATTDGYVRQALESGLLSGDGPFTQRCHELLRTMLGTPSVLLTTSGTHALELAALLLDIRPGDEVIIPSYTFSSTANAFLIRGATIVFADIRGDTFNLDETALTDLMTERTRAVIPVHYGGIACEMGTIASICAERGVTVVEDNAHGLCGAYHGQPLGTFGPLAAQSFHVTKNFSSGEGGALVINDTAMADRAEILREKGTDRGRFLRGEVDKYTWRDAGSSYLPSDLIAAVLTAQLEERESIQARRAAVWHRYSTGLRDWARSSEIGLPVVPDGCLPAYHLFSLRLPDARTRDRLAGILRGQGITAVQHYVPLHSSPMGLRLGATPDSCPVADAVGDGLLRLPFYTDLSVDDQDRVINAVVRVSL